MSCKAIAAGAKRIRPLENQFYGDRSGDVSPIPFGHIWSGSTHVEDVSPEELKKRMAALRPEGGRLSERNWTGWKPALNPVSLEAF